MAASDKHPPHRPLRRDVRELVERHLRSAAEIDLLLLLFRSPETYWSPSAAANVIGADDRDIRAHFGRFAAAGLLDRGKQTDAFRFAPSKPEDRDAVAALATLYGERREDVLRAITGSLSQITAFSDAFRFPR